MNTKSKKVINGNPKETIRLSGENRLKFIDIASNLTLSTNEKIDKANKEIGIATSTYHKYVKILQEEINNAIEKKKKKKEEKGKKKEDLAKLEEELTQKEEVLKEINIQIQELTIEKQSIHQLDYDFGGDEIELGKVIVKLSNREKSKIRLTAEIEELKNQINTEKGRQINKVKRDNEEELIEKIMEKVKSELIEIEKRLEKKIIEKIDKL